MYYFLPVQRLQMSDDFFGKLGLFEDFFRLQHFSLEIPLHGFEASQVPKIGGTHEKIKTFSFHTLDLREL